MISDLFSKTFITANNNVGIYYIRQCEQTDGIDFEGIVWHGQQFSQSSEFANIFIGKLRLQ